MRKAIVQLPIRLKSLRLLEKLTQNQLAQKLNISRSTYTYYENGKCQPSLSAIITISSIYKVSIEYLLGIEENSSRKKRKK